MSKYKILVDDDECIGCGACEQHCKNFKLINGKAIPINSEVEEVGCNQTAADCCPVEAISIKNPS